MSRIYMNPASLRGQLIAKGRRIALLLVLGAGMGGCQSASFSPATPELAARDKFPISVTPQQETLQMAPAMVGKNLRAADAAIISAYAGAYMQHGHGPLSIVLPAVPNTPLLSAQMQAINGILFERGVPAAKIEWRIATPAAIATTGAPAQAAGAVRPEGLLFSFTRYVASVAGECGDWSKDLGAYYDNQAWANFGCAQQHNLAAMIADPLDLSQPRETTPIDVDRRTVVIKAYREGQTTTSERSEQEKGTVSEVAK